MKRRVFLAGLMLALLSGCASLDVRDSLKVWLVGIEPLEGQGMEARFAVKLRVQNPNEQELRFSGIAVDLELRDLHFASGVSDQDGYLERFSETVITVPVTVPVVSMLKQALALTRAEQGRISYRLSGRMGGLRGARFDTRGELDLSPELFSPR